MQMMFSGLGSGGRSLTFESGFALAHLGGGRELSLQRAIILDHAADHVLRSERLDALGHGRDVDDLVADHHAQFVIVEKRKFHVRSLQLLIVVKFRSGYGRPDRGAVRPPMQAGGTGAAHLPAAYLAMACLPTMASRCGKWRE